MVFRTKIQHFTFDSDSDESVSDERFTEKANAVGLALLFLNDIDSHREELSDEKESQPLEELTDELSHLFSNSAGQIMYSLSIADFNACSLHHLNQTKVSAWHLLEISDNQPVYHRINRIASKQNLIIQQVLHTILNAGIITSALLTCHFQFQSL